VPFAKRILLICVFALALPFAASCSSAKPTDAVDVGSTLGGLASASQNQSFASAAMPADAAPAAQYTVMSFLDDMTGWVFEAETDAAHSSRLLKTTDGGDTWSAVADVAPLSYDAINMSFIQLDFVNEYDGWAVERENVNYKFYYYFLNTTDCGRDWVVQWVDSKADDQNIGKHVAFTSPEVGYALGDYWGKPGNFIARTTDGGATWSEVKINVTTG